MKKVGFIVSFIKSASAWLHGEGGRHFRTYTYPRIKAFTRRFINLGIYEQFERLYKIVDDTFYTGDVSYDDIDPVAVIEAEKRATEVEEGSIGVRMQELPELEDIFDELYMFKSLEQGKTYRCVTFTGNNILRMAMLQSGLKPPMEVCAIDPLYLATKAGPGKRGTASAKFIEYLGANGFPVPSWTPRMENHDTELAALEKSKVIGNAHHFNAFFTTGKYQATTSFEEAVRLDRELPANWQIQVSIGFSNSLKYFGQKVPYLRKVNGKYSLSRTGGHSVIGVRGSFSNYEDGDSGFVIIDSAYRSHEDGWRFIKAKLMQYGIITVRFVEFNVGAYEAPKPKPTPTPSPAISPLASSIISFGERSENVRLLQVYLMGAGYDIPAKATGFFGEQTRTALKAWQDDQFGPKYDGRHWGPISQERFRSLVQ